MRCYFLVTVDERDQLTGCPSVPTPRGGLVVLFPSENENMQVIARYIVDRQPEGQSIRSMYVDASSPKKVVREIKKTFLDMNYCLFLMDSDPYVTQAIAILRRMGR